MPTMLGTLLDGRYRLEAQVGAGGMSTVYKAFDERLERAVAIKLMNGELAADAQRLERFRREARAVALISHPNVVTVIDAGEGGGDARPYIVFEYVEGETLKERIRRLGRLPVVEATAYAIEVARALGAAHAHDVVHRDVKPQNVLIDEEGRAKVTDFGIARTVEGGRLTDSGRVLGTTDYVSPEQALGHPVSGQSDLYSLGIVLYEMLTGEVPFKGESQVAVAMKHVREAPPDVQARRPEVSATLAAVLDRATAKSLERRYPNAAALASDLEEALAVESARAGSASGEATSVIRTLPERTSRRVPLRLRRPVLLLAGLVAIGAVVAAVVVLAAHHAQRGTGETPDAAARSGGSGLTPVSLGQSSAHAFDPLGGDGEHDGDAFAVVDRNEGTSWSTEHYQDGNLGKAGVGIYVDARPGVAARELTVRSPAPGYTAAVYGAPAGAAAPSTLSSWTRLAAPHRAASVQRFQLATGGRRFRYYLLWITALPPGQEQASVAEIQLFR